MTSVLEDKYLRLRDEHAALKRENHDQKDVIKRMFTKLAIIEQKTAKLQGGTAGKAHREVESEELVRALRKENTLLRQKNKELAEALSKTRRVAATNSSYSRPRPRTASGRASVSRDDALRAAREEFERERAEWERERDQERQRLEWERQRVEPHRPPGDDVASRERDREAHRDVEHRLFMLQREVKNKNAELTLVKSRHDQAQAKLAAERQLYEQATNALDHHNQQLRDTRAALQAAESEVELLRARLSRLDDTEDELRQAREENASLEARFAELCESPFFKQDGVGKDLMKRTERLSVLEREARDDKAKIAHLQHTVRTRHIELEAVTREKTDLQRKVESLTKEVTRLRATTDDVQRGAEVLKQRVAMFSGGLDGTDGVPPDELDRALAIVRKRLDAPTRVDFLDAEDERDTVPELRRESQQLRLALVTAQQEQQRTEEMLRVQRTINDNLKSEVQSLQERLSSDRDTLRRDLKDAQELADRRGQRIRMLEAQVKQMLYDARGKRGRLAAVKDDEGGSVGGMTDDSFSTAELEFGPGENLCEVYVVAATLSQDLVGPHGATFCVVDFYGFESQLSPFATGPEAAYNFSASYRVTCDNYFLRHLASCNVVVEVMRTQHADHTPLARALVPLRRLLSYSGRVRLDNVPLRATSDSRIVGTLTVEMRVAIPLADLWTAYLNDHPAERRRIAMEDEETIAAAGAVQASRDSQQADLLVTVHNCSRLESKSGRKPSTYVQYTLPAQRTVFTPTVSLDCDPVYDDEHIFPVVPDAAFLDAMKRTPLRFVVYDDDDRDDDATGGKPLGQHDGAAAVGGVLGMASLNLLPLTQGKSVKRHVDLYSLNGRRVGSLSVSVAWRDDPPPVLHSLPGGEDDFDRDRRDDDWEDDTRRGRGGSGDVRRTPREEEGSGSGGRRPPTGTRDAVGDGRRTPREDGGRRTPTDTAGEARPAEAREGGRRTPTDGDAGRRSPTEGGEAVRPKETREGGRRTPMEASEGAREGGRRTPTEVDGGRRTPTEASEEARASEGREVARDGRRTPTEGVEARREEGVGGRRTPTQAAAAGSGGFVETEGIRRTPRGDTTGDERRPDEPRRPSERPDEPHHPSERPDEPRRPSERPEEPRRPSERPDEPRRPSERPDEPRRPSERPDEPRRPSERPDEPRRPSERPDEPKPAERGDTPADAPPSKSPPRKPQRPEEAPGARRPQPPREEAPAAAAGPGGSDPTPTAAGAAEGTSGTSEPIESFTGPPVARGLIAEDCIVVNVMMVQKLAASARKGLKKATLTYTFLDGTPHTVSSSKVDTKSGVVTFADGERTFPFTDGTPNTKALVAAVAPGMPPEAATLEFSLADAKGKVMATAKYNLVDILDKGDSTSHLTLPLKETPTAAVPVGRLVVGIAAEAVLNRLLHKGP